MPLRNRHILVVEDEYLLATDLRRELEAAGMVVVGPEPSVARALARLADESSIDAAVLDVNLGDELSFPIAAALEAGRIPFVFATGYDSDALANHYPNALHCRKPLDMSALLGALIQIIRPPDQPRYG